MRNIFQIKEQFDYGEIKVTELSEEELTQINNIYSKEIEELQLNIKRKMIELSKK